jgi:hypothetical protein
MRPPALSVRFAPGLWGLRVIGYPPSTMLIPSRLALLLALTLLPILRPACQVPAGSTTYTDALVKAGGVRVDMAEARRLEAELGQLLVVNVDGFGYDGPLAVLPEFLPMVERLQVGGVIPHYGTSSFQRIRGANRALARLTSLPLLICCDIVTLSTRTGQGAAVSARFGDGYVGGFIGRHEKLKDADFSALAGLNALAFSAIGVNVALGPTVDDSTRDPRTAERARVVISCLEAEGIEAVIKHFPFLPSGANLHKASPDTRVPLEEAKRRTRIFGELAGEAGIMMSTHTYDSLVDPGRIVTFSPAWNRILRAGTGFNGLLLSDGLLMLRSYGDTPLLAGGPAGDRTTSWAIRALLAGHDMLILEGGSATTYRVFGCLHAAACAGDQQGERLRERIHQSFARISAYKREREAALRRETDVPLREVGDIITRTARLSR